MSALAPRLRQRVDFEEQVETRDSEGVLTIAWTTAVADVPAEVLTGGGREFNAGGQVQSETAARITCRWFPAVKASWRIVWDGQVFNIGSMETDVTGRREWRFRCTAGVNDGQ